MSQHSDSFLSHFLDQAAHCDVATEAGRLPVAPIISCLGGDALKCGFGDLCLEINDPGLHTAWVHLLDDVADVVLIRLTDICSEALHLYACMPQLQCYCLGVESTADTDTDDVAVRFKLLQKRGCHVA
jgi:hypothetical protein